MGGGKFDLFWEFSLWETLTEFALFDLLFNSACQSKTTAIQLAI